MSEPTKVEGVDYTPEGIAQLRQKLITWRDTLMYANAPIWADEIVILTHAIAILAYHIERETLLAETISQINQIPWQVRGHDHE